MWYHAAFCMVATLACAACTATADKNPRPDSNASASVDAASEPGTPNACRMLTSDEVAAFVESAITISDQVESEPGYSVCQWESDGVVVFKLTMFWTMGRQQWDAWRTAQGLADDILVAQEGVQLDSIVRQGPVGGIGDKAYFSELLPSLVLKDDVLFEIHGALAKRPAAKFRRLASQLLSRL